MSTKVKRKIRYKGSDMPEDGRKGCEDVMSVIENNGEVTLPNSRPNDPLIAKRQLQMVLMSVAILVGLAFVARPRR